MPREDLDNDDDDYKPSPRRGKTARPQNGYSNNRREYEDDVWSVPASGRSSTRPRRPPDFFVNSEHMAQNKDADWGAAFNARLPDPKKKQRPPPPRYDNDPEMTNAAEILCRMKREATLSREEEERLIAKSLMFMQPDGRQRSEASRGGGSSIY